MSSNNVWNTKWWSWWYFSIVESLGVIRHCSCWTLLVLWVPFVMFVFLQNCITQFYQSSRWRKMQLSNCQAQVFCSSLDKKCQVFGLSLLCHIESEIMGIDISKFLCLEFSFLPWTSRSGFAWNCGLLVLIFH